MTPSMPVRPRGRFTAARLLRNREDIGDASAFTGATR